MMRVNIEIVPFGQEAGSKKIHTLYIANVATIKSSKTDTLCRYECWLDVDPRVGPDEKRPRAHAALEHWRGHGPVMLTAKAAMAIEKAVNW